MCSELNHLKLKCVSCILTGKIYFRILSWFLNFSFIIYSFIFVLKQEVNQPLMSISGPAPWLLSLWASRCLAPFLLFAEPQEILFLHIFMLHGFFSSMAKVLVFFFYHQGFSDYYLRLYCYFHNIFADMYPGLLQMFVEFWNLHGTSNYILYCIHGDHLFRFR